jgi:hypothetical protein
MASVLENYSQTNKYEMNISCYACIEFLKALDLFSCILFFFSLLMSRETGISKPYLEELRAQENHPVQEAQFFFQALDLNFEISSFKVGDIVFPAQFIERPGFEFLQS